jgi:colanic acid/amylovoran biosynthesis glycosyltransferase
MKKIAYFCGTYPSLSETFVQREIDYLNAHGFEVFVFAARRPDYLPAEGERRDRSKKGIYMRPDHLLSGVWSNLVYMVTRPAGYFRCVGYAFAQFKHFPLTSCFKYYYHLFTAATFLRRIRKDKIDHIHAHFTMAATCALFCHVIGKIPFSFTAHATGDIYVAPVMLREKMGQAAFVVTISEYNKRYLNLLFDYAYDRKIHVVHNGVPIPPKPAGRASRPVPELLAVSNFTLCKGYSTLIEALAIVRDRGPHFHLNIAGDGGQRPALEKLIGRLHLEGHITLLGYAENDSVMELMRTADMLVMPSEIHVSGMRDGIPTVCAEAMSFGLPVISTYISGIPELIEDGVSGLLVPERNPEMLARAIARLIDDPELRKDLGEAGYDRVAALFDIEKTMKQFVEVIERFAGFRGA